MPTAEQRFVSFPNKYGPYVGKCKTAIVEYEILILHYGNKKIEWNS